MRRPALDNPLVEYLCRRIELMDRQVQAERERAQEAQALNRQRDATRGEVEDQLKNISAQLAREKTERDSEQEKSHSRGRVDALEQRLDEMHKTWSDLLKEAISKRDTGPASAEATQAVVTEEIRLIRQDMAQLREALGTLPTLMPELHGLRSEIPASVARREADERRLAEEVRAMVQRFESAVLDRMGEIDRRLALEMDKAEERLSSLARERSAMEAALEEQRNEVHQAYLKERTALQAQFNEQLAGVRASLEKVAARERGEDDQTRAFKELLDRFQKLLERPAHAKDQILGDLEREKQDLMKALRERTEQLRAYTMERREVERSMGESLMAMNRQVEEERRKHQGLASRSSDLELRARELEARLALAVEGAAERDRRAMALAAERDEIAKALIAESEKVRRLIAAKVDSDREWEERLKAAEARVAEARDAALKAEGSVADLRAQVQSLSEHLARILREKDQVGGEAAQWRGEREQLLSTVRKKDEMISMLSAMFQNLLKK